MYRARRCLRTAGGPPAARAGGPAGAAAGGPLNRRSAEQRLRELVAQGGRFCVALADLDRFKLLNDTYGHESGDRALRLFAQVAQEALRDDDTVARWGGEEFLLILPDLDRFQAVEMTDRVRAVLARSHPGETARFTASFGVADSSQSDSIERLVQIADVGLYAAKQAGRDRAKIGDPESVDQAEVQPDASRARNGGERARRPASRRGERPPIQQAAMEEEPRPSGAEIR